MAALEKMLEDLVTPNAIPGLSLATLRAGRLEAAHAIGIRGARDPSPVDAQTVFEAASLTKPLVSFIALQLAEEGLLDLDAPLEYICGTFVPLEARARRITALHVLAHTSGLPNIVREQAPLMNYFEAGERLIWGSSAFAWLQLAMEIATGKPLEALARQRVFEPFGMRSSSLEWQERFADNHAQGHDWKGEPVTKRRVEAAQASWSLLTTASDYALFLQAVMREQGLSPRMYERWFTPTVQARQGDDAEDLFGVHPPDENVAWGLGWGLEPAQNCFFQWGHSPGFRAYVVGNRGTQDAVVWFANAACGLRLAHTILPATVLGEHPGVRWLKIGRL